MSALDAGRPAAHTGGGSGETIMPLYRVHKMRRRDRRRMPWVLWWHEPPGQTRAYKTFSLGPMAERMAERHREAWQAELNGLRDPEADGTVRWTDFERRYLESAGTGLKAASLGIARQVLRRFAAIVRPRFLADITRADVDRYRVARRAEVAQTTIAKDLRTLQSAFAWALDLELIPANPVGRLRLHGRAAHPDPDALTPEQTKQFLSLLSRDDLDLRGLSLSATAEKGSLPTWVQASLRLACLWGPRAGELARMVRRDIDFAGRTIRIPVAGGRTTKEGRGKTIPVDEDTLGLLQELSHRDGPILWGAGVRSDRGYRETVGEVARRLFARLSVRPQDDKPLQFLRRTTETNLRRRGVPDWMVARILGHGTRVGEQFYDAFGPEELARHVAQLMRAGVPRGSPLEAEASGDGLPPEA